VRFFRVISKEPFVFVPEAPWGQPTFYPGQLFTKQDLIRGGLARCDMLLVGAVFQDMITHVPWPMLPFYAVTGGLRALVRRVRG
jgi:hypothetical protein